MKRMLKIILILVSLLILGCDSSKKVVTLPGPEVPDGVLEVKFVPQFTYVSMQLKLSEVGSTDFQYIPINESLLLDADIKWVLNGSYKVDDGSGNIIQDYINSFYLQLSIHESANKKSIRYLIYDDGTIYPEFN